MKPSFFYSNFLRRNDGSAILEFAVVAPIFFLLFFGILEFGLYTYHQMAVERIAMAVSRIAAIGKMGDSSGCPQSTAGTDSDKQLVYMKCVVKRMAGGLIDGDRIEVVVNTLAAGGTPSAPDICIEDTLPLPSSAPATCDKYEDVNGDGKYNGADASNVGGRGQTIQIRVLYPFSVQFGVQFPIMNQYFGGGVNGISMITTATVIKNEPFR